MQLTFLPENMPPAEQKKVVENIIKIQRLLAEASELAAENVAFFPESDGFQKVVSLTTRNPQNAFCGKVLTQVGDDLCKIRLALDSLKIK